MGVFACVSFAIVLVSRVRSYSGVMLCTHCHCFYSRVRTQEISISTHQLEAVGTVGVVGTVGLKEGTIIIN